MRYVPIDKATPGMVLGDDLFDTQGRVVIGVGTELTENYIKRLAEYGYGGVYIDDPIFSDVEIESAIPPELRHEGMKCIKNMDVDKCKKIAKQIVDELLPKDNICLDMADIRTYDDYTYGHSVNVAVLSCSLGIGMKLREAELEYLVTAALLHDLGKVMIPQEILNKPGRLTQEEFLIMKSHPSKSYELLADQYDLSAHVKQTVLFHHENVDGSGYPNGLVGEEQSILIKILHVADVFDALTANRPYKRGYPPFDAAEYLMGACGSLFDKNVVECFLKVIPLYPRGTEILLSTGQRGFVVENGGDHNLRPVIRLLPGGETLDLGERENYNITIVHEDESETAQQIKDETSRKEMIKPIKKYRLMIVDDMVSNLQMLRGILEFKYDLKLLKSGKQALDYLEKNEFPDLVLMDIDMPEMDGVETARRINALTDNKVPILFVSAVCDKETVLLCKSINAAGYIAKPYQSIYIKAEIEKILNGWGER